MITVISGTNRPNSYTSLVAKHYYNRLGALSADARFVSLADVDSYFDEPSNVYKKDSLSAQLLDIQNKILIPSSKFVFVVPEYNGSYAGIFKYFLDALSVHQAKATFGMKKVLLVGVSDGRAGNLRGLEHLTGTSLHLGMVVHPNRLPISLIAKQINEQGVITDEGALKAIDAQLEQFVRF